MCLSQKETGSVEGEFSSFRGELKETEGWLVIYVTSKIKIDGRTARRGGAAAQRTVCSPLGGAKRRGGTMRYAARL